MEERLTEGVRKAGPYFSAFIILLALNTFLGMLLILDGPGTIEPLSTIHMLSMSLGIAVLASVAAIGFKLENDGLEMASIEAAGAACGGLLGIVSIAMYTGFIVSGAGPGFLQGDKYLIWAVFTPAALFFGVVYGLGMALLGSVASKLFVKKEAGKTLSDVEI